MSFTDSAQKHLVQTEPQMLRNNVNVPETMLLVFHGSRLPTTIRKYQFPISPTQQR